MEKKKKEIKKTGVNSKNKKTKLSNKKNDKKCFDLNKIWSLLFLLIFGWIFSICLMDGNYKFNPLAVIIAMVILVISSVCLYKKLGN